MMPDVVQWLQEKILFRRDKPIPILGFRFNHHTTTVYGIVPFNTAGTAVVQAFLPSFGFLKFDQPSTLTRVELTISVRTNTNNAYIGAMIVVNANTAGQVFDFTQATNVICSNIVTATTAVISKNFYFGAYGGHRFEPNETLALAVLGDNTGICGICLNYHWLSYPGQIIRAGEQK